MRIAVLNPLRIIVLHYVDTKQISLNQIVFARNERAARENMRDDKIYRLVSARSIARSLALVRPAKLVAVREKGYTTYIGDSRGRGGPGEKGRVDGDKADAIITIFFLYTPYSQLEITRAPVDEALCRVTPLTRGRLSFTNPAPFPFRSAP